MAYRTLQKKGARSQKRPVICVFPVRNRAKNGHDQFAVVMTPKNRSRSLAYFPGARVSFLIQKRFRDLSGLIVRDLAAHEFLDSGFRLNLWHRLLDQANSLLSDDLIDHGFADRRRSSDSG